MCSWRANRHTAPRQTALGSARKLSQRMVYSVSMKKADNKSVTRTGIRSSDAVPDQFGLGSGSASEPTQSRRVTAAVVGVTLLARVSRTEEDCHAESVAAIGIDRFLDIHSESSARTGNSRRLRAGRKPAHADAEQSLQGKRDAALDRRGGTILVSQRSTRRRSGIFKLR